MSRRADGTDRCDRCDQLLPNDGIFSAAVASDLHPFRPGESRQLHWCRENGCAVAVLNPENLAAWLASEGILP